LKRVWLNVMLLKRNERAKTAKEREICFIEYDPMGES
jgi:hypothetical protein